MRYNGTTQRGRQDTVYPDTYASGNFQIGAITKRKYFYRTVYQVWMVRMVRSLAMD